MDTVGAHTATTTHAHVTAHTVAHPLPPCTGLPEGVVMGNHSIDNHTTAPGNTIATMAAHLLQGGVGATMDVTESTTFFSLAEMHVHTV